jgi:hypothetical protein
MFTLAGKGSSPGNGILFINATRQRVSNGTLTASLPSGVEDGDLLVAFVGNINSGSTVGLTGFSAALEETVAFVDSEQNLYIKVFTKIASSEPSSYSVTGPSSAKVVVIAAYRGADSIQIGDRQSAESWTSITLPAFTAESSGILTGVIISRQGLFGTITPPSGFGLVAAKDGNSPDLSVYQKSSASGSVDGSEFGISTGNGDAVGFHSMIYKAA